MVAGIDEGPGLCVISNEHTAFFRRAGIVDTGEGQFEYLPELFVAFFEPEVKEEAFDVYPFGREFVLFWAWL